MKCKIKIFVFTSMDGGQKIIDEWLANHPLIYDVNMELTSNKWNICLAISYKEENNE